LHQLLHHDSPFPRWFDVSKSGVEIQGFVDCSPWKQIRSSKRFHTIPLTSKHLLNFHLQKLASKHTIWNRNQTSIADEHLEKLRIDLTLRFCSWSCKRRKIRG
jgi:hypothetical protein